MQEDNVGTEEALWLTSEEAETRWMEAGAYFCLDLHSWGHYGATKKPEGHLRLKIRYRVILKQKFNTTLSSSVLN